MKGKGKIHQNSEDVRPNCRVIGLHRHRTAPAVHFLILYSLIIDNGEEHYVLVPFSVWVQAGLGLNLISCKEKKQ